jgi:hypothetical protein
MDDASQYLGLWGLGIIITSNVAWGLSVCLSLKFAGIQFKTSKWGGSQSQMLRGLRRACAAARLLGLWV